MRCFFVKIIKLVVDKKTKDYILAPPFGQTKAFRNSRPDGKEVSFNRLRAGPELKRTGESIFEN